VDVSPLPLQYFHLSFCSGASESDTVTGEFGQTLAEMASDCIPSLRAFTISWLKRRLDWRRMFGKNEAEPRLHLVSKEDGEDSEMYYDWQWTGSEPEAEE